MNQQARLYTPHSLSDLTASMTAFLEGQSPEETFLVVLDPKSAVSHPDQLLGILCLDKWPRSVQRITVPRINSNNEEAEEPKALRVVELTADDYQLLTERAIVEDGPVVVHQGRHLRPARVLFLKPSAYPPRSLNHCQTCGNPECRISSDSTELRTLTMRTTEAPTTPQVEGTAAAAVLRCTELLELILLHVDLKSRIVSAPRVCRFWLDTLNHSPALRKACFFQADRALDPPKYGERPYINPLLQEAFGDYFFDLSNSNTSGEKHIFRRAEYFWKLPFSPTNLPLLKAKTGSVVDVDPSCRQRAFIRKGASWRRMLVSQPPPPFLGFTWLDLFPGADPVFDYNSIELPATNVDFEVGGVTMGLLYDTVQSLTMHQNEPGLFFRVRWDIRFVRISRYGEIGSEELEIETTNLATQFWDDAYFNSKNYGPFSMEATRRVFTCEEAVRPAFCGDEAWVYRAEGVDDVRNVPGNDEYELWEPLAWGV